MCSQPAWKAAPPFRWGKEVAGPSRCLEGNVSTDTEIKEMLVELQVLVWCPFSCSPPCCPFARVSVKECLMLVCKAGDQRCLLGPFVFSSWDLMAWMLLKIFFWWPIMVMPRLRTSLENKDTVRHPMGWTCAEPQRDTCLLCVCTPWTSRGPHTQLLSVCPWPQGCCC